MSRGGGHKEGTGSEVLPLQKKGGGSGTSFGHAKKTCFVVVYLI